MAKSPLRVTAVTSGVKSASLLDRRATVSGRSVRLRASRVGSVVDPGFGVAGELDDGFGEGSVGEVGERDGLEDGAEVGADGDPCLPQGFGGARVLDDLGVFAPDVRQGSLNGPDRKSVV